MSNENGIARLFVGRVSGSCSKNVAEEPADPLIRDVFRFPVLPYPVFDILLPSGVVECR
jgi:hypothetical protein